MSRSYDSWMRERDPWAVVEAADEDDRARDAAVSRIIDTMLEVQLDYSHVAPGWPPISSTELACSVMRGELMGGGYGGGDAMLAAYGRAWKGSPWHCACHYLLGRLPARAAAAMLMQAARVRPAKDGVGNWWCKTNRELFLNQGEALQRLQLKDRGVAPFGSVRAWQLYAEQGRRHLREWLQQGEVNKIDQKSKKSVDHAADCGLL